MCAPPIPNYRVEEPECLHSMLEPARIRVNEGGFYTFCHSCGAMVSWSTVEEPKEKTAEEQNLWVYEKLVPNERSISELTDEEKEKLA